HLQLFVCYWQLGDREKAKIHNDKAASYHPSHPSVLYNQNVLGT
ncbi:UNVERIFIED_CONTAM: glycosyl transferase, partial [Bacillus amyloliquefaciens DSM 7 = ATCC 23350]